MYTIIYICTAVLAKVQFWNKTFSVCNVAFLYLKNFALQVDLPRAYSMSAISTQGAVSEKSWVSSYLVHYHNGKAFNPLTDIKGQIKVPCVKNNLCN